MQQSRPKFMTQAVCSSNVHGQVYYSCTCGTVYRVEGDCFNVPSTKASRDFAFKNWHSLHSVALAEQPRARTIACMHACMRKENLQPNWLFSTRPGKWHLMASEGHAILHFTLRIKAPRNTHHQQARLPSVGQLFDCCWYVLVYQQLVQHIISFHSATQFRRILPPFFVYHHKTGFAFCTLAFQLEPLSVLLPDLLPNFLISIMVPELASFSALDLSNLVAAMWPVIFSPQRNKQTRQQLRSTRSGHLPCVILHQGTADQNAEARTQGVRAHTVPRLCAVRRQHIFVVC